MADITRRVNRGIPPTKRFQSWDSAVHRNDAGEGFAEGDIFQVETSLGHPASHVNIVVDTTPAGSMSVRFNPEVRIFRRRDRGEYGYLSENEIWVASGITWSGDTSMNAIILEEGDTYNIDNELPVSTIQLATYSGVHFTVVVS